MTRFSRRFMFEGGSESGHLGTPGERVYPRLQKLRSGWGELGAGLMVAVETEPAQVRWIDALQRTVSGVSVVVLGDELGGLDGVGLNPLTGQNSGVLVGGLSGIGDSKVFLIC